MTIVVTLVSSLTVQHDLRQITMYRVVQKVRHNVFFKFLLAWEF